MFKRHWFSIVDAAPAKAERIRRWDLTATAQAGKNDPDWTAGVKMSVADGTYYVEHVKRFRGSARDVEKAILQCAPIDGQRCYVGLPEDPGQRGGRLPSRPSLRSADPGDARGGNPIRGLAARPRMERQA